MDPVLSMFLTCSHLFPGALTPSVMICVKGMEGKLCCCGKGRKQEVLEEISSILDSPLVLGEDINNGVVSDDSYHTPPIASSSLPPSSLAKSDKENLVVLYNSQESCCHELKCSLVISRTYVKRFKT